MDSPIQPSVTKVYAPCSRPKHGSTACDSPFLCHHPFSSAIMRFRASPPNRLPV